MSHKPGTSINEQILKYDNLQQGNTLQGMLSTDSMASVHKLPTYTLDEYLKFFNWNEPQPGLRDMSMKRYKPKGIDFPSFDEFKIHGNAITQAQKNDRLTHLAYTKRPVQVNSRFQEAPVFLSSG